MTIKKAFVELVELLESNENKKVSTILEQVYLLAESKKQNSTVMYNEDGKVIAIFCWYHKQWEVVSEVEFGAKATSKSGYNTMCKIGTAAWTKSQRDAKNKQTKLLEDVSNGIVEPQDILLVQAEIEAERNVMDITDMPKGYASEEEILS